MCALVMLYASCQRHWLLFALLAGSNPAAVHLRARCLRIVQAARAHLLNHALCLTLHCLIDVSSAAHRSAHNLDCSYADAEALI